MEHVELYLASTSNSLENMIKQSYVKKEPKKKITLKEHLKNCFDDLTSLDDSINISKDFFKNNYKELLIFNGKLLIAEGTGSATGAGAGELLGNYVDDKGLVTAGTIVTDWLTCLIAYGFIDSVEKREASKKRLSRIGIAYTVSSILSGVFKWGYTLHYNKKGYSGGESALLARIPATCVYLLSMNVLGYIMGLVGKEEKKTL